MQKQITTLMFYGSRAQKLYNALNFPMIYKNQMQCCLYNTLFFFLFFR